MAKLYFRYGAMNSGKSTALLQAAYNYEERGQHVLLAKPAIDTKEADHISSRLGVTRPVDFLIPPVADLRELFAHHREQLVRPPVQDYRYRFGVPGGSSGSCKPPHSQR